MKNRSELKIRARRDNFLGERIEITIGARFPDGCFRAAKDLKFVEVIEGQIVDPTVKLTVTESQQLMDELWNCGVRPTEGAGSAGMMAATQRHLEDLRAIVSKKLGVTLRVNAQ